MGKPDRKRKTFTVRLTRFELIHLRDLFGIKMAPDLAQTVSQMLAAAEERPIIEAKLWQTIVTACKEAELPTDDEAPDYVCAAETVNVRPGVGIYRLADEPSEAGGAEGNNPFEGDEENPE